MAETKRPPSWWWFLGPVVLGVLAVLVGAGALVSTIRTVSAAYETFRPTGEPHEVTVPTAHRVMLMAPSTVDRTRWRCGVTDSGGTAIPTSEPSGTFSWSNGDGRWRSLLTFDPAAAATPGADEATVLVSCSRLEEGPGQTVRVLKAPSGGAIAGRIATMILGPLLLGGIGFVWFLVLVVLQVVRRTAVAA